MDNNLCSICLTNIINDSYKLKCGHVFHKKCILKWQKKSKKEDGSFSCPICRNENSYIRLPDDNTILIMENNNRQSTPNFIVKFNKLISIILCILLLFMSFIAFALSIFGITRYYNE